MKKIMYFIFCVFFSLILCSCGASPKNDSYSSDPVLLGDIKTIEEVELTCVAHDDNINYNAWLNAINGDMGYFNFYESTHTLYTNNRIKVYTPVGNNFEVSLLNDNDEIIYTTIPDVNGICYLFPNWYSYSYNILVKYYDSTFKDAKEEKFNVTDELRININTNKVVKEEIDLMFVVDTTASMGDELDYLKNEITDVIERVTSFNDCNVNVSILLYKDKGEIYETLYSDFNNDVNEQVKFLENKIAYGGGDYEECVDVAIEEATNKNWSLNSTKVLIHIADAPAHDEDINKWHNAVLKLSGMGIQMITVASSGVNKKTEYLFRAMTLITNGTYVAITNHSNVGDEHIDSSNSTDLVVEYLDNCLVRIINGYHSGVTYNPIPIN